MNYPFYKMHGLGNDFVIMDWRDGMDLSAIDVKTLAQKMGDRHGGVGFDQLILILPPQDQQTHAHLRFFNQDGSEAGACGNGTRCAAHLLFNDKTILDETLILTTIAGHLTAKKDKSNTYIWVNMGKPFFSNQDIPIQQGLDRQNLPLTLPKPFDKNQLAPAQAVGMGNPHCVFMVKDIEEIDINAIGPALEHHDIFPNRANIGFVEQLGIYEYRLKVWERGAGLTHACGSGTTAAMVVVSLNHDIHRGQEVSFISDGGLKYRDSQGQIQLLKAIWNEDDSLMQAGPTEISYIGAWTI